MFRRYATTITALLIVAVGLFTTPLPDAAGQAGVGDMAYVPAGYFLMGSSVAEFNEAVRLCQVAGVADCAKYFTDELPQVQVYTDAFYIDLFETTNAEYAACVAAGVCTPPYDFSAYSYPFYYNNPAFANYPVIHVDWFDADTYCRWRGKRLLTEAEWEKAARWNPDTGLVTMWPFGNTIRDFQANLCDQTCGFSGRYPVNDGYADIAPVGSYPAGASPVGAYDMAGNVWEWVADYYDAAYYSYGEVMNPLGPTMGSLCIRRGGAFNNPAAFTRSANRKEDAPTTQDHQLGIRCGMSEDGVIDGGVIDGGAVDGGVIDGGGAVDSGVVTGGSTVLTVGSMAMVNVVNDTLALRTGPGVSYTRLEGLMAGVIVTIIDGPSYGNGYTWWYVAAPSGNMGWVVDYADGIATLIPY